jgi:acetyl-CoA acetyltransferase
MGETGENVAEQNKVSREEQDAFALVSHQRAVAAIEAGRFANQIVPVMAPQAKGQPIEISRDEHPRADTSMEALARLKPAFREGGSVTAGNSSGINDGASATVVVASDFARANNLKALARGAWAQFRRRARRWLAPPCALRTSTSSSSTKPSLPSQSPSCATWASTRTRSTSTAAPSPWVTRWA